MKKEELLARAKELQLEVPEGATNPQIEAAIKVAEHPLLAQAVKDLSAENNDLKSELESETKAKDALQAQLDEASKPLNVANTATYKNDTGTYAFAVKSFRYKGDKYIAVEAVENTDLMEALIKSNFIHLKKQ